MEEMIKEEVEEFIKLIKKKNCKPFDCIQQFNLPILNALWKVTSGKRFDYDDRRLISIVEKLSLWFKRMGRPEDVLTFAFPWMTKIYPKFNEYDETLDTTHGIMNMMKESIEEHENTLDANDPRDFIDKFLIEATKTTKPDSSFYGETGRVNLANTLFDLFLAGSETTSTSHGRCSTWPGIHMCKREYKRNWTQLWAQKPCPPYKTDP